MSKDQTNYLVVALLLCLGLVGAVMWARRPPPPPVTLATVQWFTKQPCDIVVTMEGRTLLKQRATFGVAATPAKEQVVVRLYKDIITIYDGNKKVICTLNRSGANDIEVTTRSPMGGGSWGSGLPDGSGKMTIAIVSADYNDWMNKIALENEHIEADRAKMLTSGALKSPPMPRPRTQP